MIELYSRRGCSSCIAAEQILNSINKSYIKIYAEEDKSMDEIKDMFTLARSFPIIVVNDKFIGGIDELRSKILNEGQDFDKVFLVEETRVQIIKKNKSSKV